ncbi:hypothetical protein BCU70_19210 [Vibrio sp. 10N.286.49.C2]|uniref:hypothetical protein n=1 Tax=unclassified Vibrio TaxID=2614977 RepID=UPI000C84ABD6|nr:MULTISPECIES: hypothetical protein [unclassified Vibrio]PMH34794.1 hypothetical protein BCU70_19210 [Vibrio sp. 10N.286.49.C2]PMH51418.1 hypothetical protein BCU66_16905 [Vibrio sp. 10N.286.49.B1]PMH81825.1 hypothetical protein BCU58_20395 [Vibrio sp. 10N.286.48.B7]
MLLDVVVHSLNQFQDDCLNLCAHHYPAVHNKGMTEHHLGLAFVKRLVSNQSTEQQHCEFAPIEMRRQSDAPQHYRVSSSQGTVWVLTHHFVNASPSSRALLFEKIQEWQLEYSYAIQPHDLLVLIADHWINRNIFSREIIHWWTHQLPEDCELYAQQGVRLTESTDYLRQNLLARNRLTPRYIHYSHPIKRTLQRDSLKKYVQLYAIIQG